MLDRCFLLPDMSRLPGAGGGGGNTASSRRLVVRRHAALGDAVAALVIADKLIDQDYEVQFQSHPSLCPVIRRNRDLYSIGPVNGFAHVNLDGAYENHPQRHAMGFWEIYVEAANHQLRARDIQIGPPLNCRPRLHVSDQEKSLVFQVLGKHEKPWIFICPRSHTYAARTVQDGTWAEASALMPGTKFWIGIHGPAPAGMVDLGIRDLDLLTQYLSCADILATVDTGPMHVAAALGVPIVAICQASSPEVHLNDQNDFLTIYPPNLSCLNCQKNLCPIREYQPPCQDIEPARIAQAVNARLSGIMGDTVSACVSVYKPDWETLNRCLGCVIPQVDEVVVCSDTAGIIPERASNHPKVRYVRCPRHDIGYGRKQNFAARHAHGHYLLFLNDDVFLNPGAVESMKQEMKAGVGIVGNLLRYPDNTIQHAGKIRTPGLMGWHHIDHLKYEPTIREPCEMENICGACNLVSRYAHFRIGGFDEEFYLYSEDDDYALRMRQNGWKIRYTPHSSGIHIEHQSTSKTGAIMDQVNRANATFDRKWRWYLLKNINTIPGTF